jgi:hypothetical protein
VIRRGTANILVTLRGVAVPARFSELADACDVLALQEWPRGRNALLSETGRLRHGPWLRRTPDRGDWSWSRPRLGGGPIGIHKRLDEVVVSCKAKVLAGVGRVDPEPGRRTVLTPSFATRVKSRRLEDDSIVVRYNIHLTAHVQTGQRGYRADQPKRVARHMAERRKLDRLVARDLERGYEVEVYGDTNYHHMPIAGLVAWWSVEPGAGTLGNRAIDGIWTSRRPTDVDFLPALVPGEHRHVITTGL